MNDNYTRLRFDSVFKIESIVTLFYMEMQKTFHYDGEQHDFWEMVYIDKGEMICTAGDHRFILRSGEMTFHKPNEFHNLSGNGSVNPNVSIVTFVCKSQAMQYFNGKIFRLSSEEKAVLSKLFSEGLSCYSLLDARDPLKQTLVKNQDSPFGSSQMTKNYLEIFLILLRRNTDVVLKSARRSYVINGVDVPYNVKEIIDYLIGNIYNRITVKDVARAVGKSESTVKQLFATYRPTGIIHYYNSLKIAEAKELIRSGQYNITQVSDMLCYSNPQYFSRCFLQHTNMTPSEYRSSIIK